ncbi:hypothetical protein COBT_003123 [Conglomerata obtusa]
MNDCAIDILWNTTNKRQKCPLFYYNNDIAIALSYNEKFLVFFVPEHNVYIKRYTDDNIEVKINNLLELELNNKNIQQNFLCFSQKFRKKIVYWFVTEQNNAFTGCLTKLPLKDVARLCRDVCQGLVYLHEKNVINNNINRFSIFSVQRSNEKKVKKLRELILDIKN